ncbi:MAG: hypothetical protein KAG53_10030 [Endozoicomonadaceae bacterium]|nr:hypothetical protein [Endozoicomonadaceae bacterium]
MCSWLSAYIETYCIRKFCHLELGGDVPEASSLGRFRTRLVEHHLWDKWLAEINRQLEAKNIIMSEDHINIIDATPIEAAQSGSGNNKGGKPTKDSEERTRNNEIAVTRAGGERPFATYKRHYGLARTRFMDLAKNTTIYELAAMAANLCKGAQFLVLYGVPKICSTG